MPGPPYQPSGTSLDDGGALSWDGRYVAFASSAANLVPGDTNQHADVFVHDLLTGSTARVSLDDLGEQVGYDSTYPSISGDGRAVTYLGSVADVIPLSPSGDAFQTYLHRSVIPGRP